MSQNKYIVYEHLFPNGKRYIGITRTSTHRRWEKDGNGYKTQTVFRAIQKYGWENVKHNILFENLSKDEACKKEQEMIALYKSNNKHYGYNNTSGGEGGTVMNEQTRKRMCKAQKGHKCAESTKIANRNRLLGTKRPRDQVEKTRQKLLGKKIGMSEYRHRRIIEGIRNMSEEKRRQWRENVDKALISKRNVEHHGKDVIQIDAKTKEIITIYKSVCEAARKTGINRLSIQDACNGRRKKISHLTNGYLWEFGDLRGYKKQPTL